MPLYKTINPTSNTTVLVWKIEEELAALEDIFLNESSLIRVTNMKSEIHKKGFLSVRHLLKVLNYSDKDLFYTTDGKPHLRNGKRISITHSFNYSAIIVSNQVIGIDIEKNRPKIIRIAKKFIGKEKEYLTSFKDLSKIFELDSTRNELNLIMSDLDSNYSVINKMLIRQLTVIWGAKESLYKIHPDGNLSFRNHLPIEKFKLEDQKTRGWIKKDNFYEVYTIHFEQIDDFTLVYALN